MADGPVLLSRLLGGEFKMIESLTGRDTAVHLPNVEVITGTAELQRAVEDEAAWVDARRAKAKFVCVTATPERRVEEAVLELDAGKNRVEVPVATVLDTSRPDEAVVRVYHSTWPMTGGHRVRAPILDGDPRLRCPDVVGDYQDGLATGNVDAIMAAFDSRASVREPAGGKFDYRGRKAIKAFYATLVGNGGGIPLEHCAVADDGVRCALEYNVTRWGKTALPAQAGVAVYERAASGLLGAVRIYDDVAPPAAG